MIEKLTNFTCKSFKNYTGPSPVFKKRNVIFGYNGKGKSSLAKGIKDEFLHHNSENGIRSYDQNYITSNFAINESTIRGVKATFGKTNVDIEEDIKKLTESIVDTAPIEQQAENIKERLIERISQISTEFKGNLRIQNKRFNEGLDNVFRSFANDYDEAHKILNDDGELATIKGDDEIKKSLESLQQLVLPALSLSFTFGDAFKESLALFEQSFGDEIVPTADVLEWIRRGLQLHKEGDGCFFCGNKDVDLQRIKLELETFSKTRKQQAALSLTKFRSSFETLVQNIDSFSDSKSLLEVKLGETCGELIDKIVGFRPLFERILKAYDDKLAHIDEVIIVDKEEVLNEIKSIEALQLELQKIRNERIKSLELQYAKQDKLVKGSIAYHVLHDAFMLEKKKEFSEKQKEIDTARSNNSALEKQISELKLKESTTGDFALFVSGILKDLEMDFKLELEGENYILKNINEDIELKVTDISEGERNLLSLLYFYYELFEDNEQKQFRKEIQLIIVDDPFYSVDDNNKMFILSLIDKVLSLDEPQVFVFTHIWDDFNQLIYRTDPNREVYQVIKQGSSSIMKLQKYVTPYHHDFSEVYNFSRKKQGDSVLEDEIYHIPNTMRRVLEQFMSFKLSGNAVPTGSNIENVKKVLFKEPGTISQKDRMKTDILLKVCNVYSHKSIQNSEELLSSAKFLMARIQEMDKTHFDSMKTI